ncbi:MAG: membrane associated rhomboid family serine protease [Parvicellaceae bacterium]
MIQSAAIIAVILIALNAIFSFQGFKKESFMDRFDFHIDPILKRKEFYRLISSGFLHVSWVHLGMNMLALYFFTQALVIETGIIPYFVIYFASLIGGNLLALFLRNNHGDYRAVGASGAVSGLVFAFIALGVGDGIQLIFIPVPIPGWIFGVIYVAYSIYGIKSRKDNIGHEAHLGGGIVGMIVMVLFQPNLIIENYLTIGLMLIPTVVFLVLIVKKPNLLLINKKIRGEKPKESIDHQFNANKLSKEKELDHLLDKIGLKGIDSLSKKEKMRLEELSK